jgi:hypothetical protein
MVRQLCKIHLCSEFAWTLQNYRVDASDLLAFHHEIIVLSTS